MDISPTIEAKIILYVKFYIKQRKIEFYENSMRLGMIFKNLSLRNTWKCNVNL